MLTGLMAQDPWGSPIDGIAMELARGAPPPQGGLQGLLQDPKMLALLGSLRGFGDERAKMQQAIASRHYVAPPNVGGGANPQALMGPLFQQAAQKRGHAPLGTSLLGGGGGGR
jgi:hypothetical protein